MRFASPQHVHRTVRCLTSMVGPAKVSDCKVTDCGSHMQRVISKFDGEVDKDTVTLDEEKGEIAFIEEGHDVERVAATHKNPHRYEMYRRNVRDRLRMEIGVKTTALSMMKLAGRLKSRRVMSSITKWFPTP